MRRRTWAVKASSAIGVAALAMAGWVAWSAGAFAVSAPTNPSQQDCPWNADAWNTPANATYPGCHSLAVNLESGGTTNGDPNSDNTRYVEYGSDQNGIDPNSQGTPTILGIGYPGDTGEPHAGCLSANTDGTNHQPDPNNSSPGDSAQPSGPATEDSPYGCGNNPQGAGFEANYDTYQFYCPIVATLGQPCEDPSPPGSTTLTPDTGSAVNSTPIVQNGVLLYFGMDDNVDNSEHDGFDGCNSLTGSGHSPQRCSGTGQTNTGTDGAINGPSDGGGMLLTFFPMWIATMGPPTATHPEGLANYSSGFCADGICGGATTQQYTMYYGCNPSGNTNTYNGTDGATNPQNNAANDQCAPGTPTTADSFENSTPSSTKESGNCNGGGPYGGPSGTEEPCFTNSDGTPNSAGANGYRSGTAQQVTDEPGVQVSQDPDPQRSPAAPFGTPGVYAGTCGVYLNDGGGYGMPGVSGMSTGGAVSADPGWVAQTDPNC